MITIWSLGPNAKRVVSMWREGSSLPSETPITQSASLVTDASKWLRFVFKMSDGHMLDLSYCCLICMLTLYLMFVAYMSMDTLPSVV